MKGVVFLGDRKLELREFPDPTPGPRDVILEIKASGMCGTDLHTYRAPAQLGEAVAGGIKRQGIHFCLRLAYIPIEASLLDSDYTHVPSDRLILRSFMLYSAIGLAVMGVAAGLAFRWKVLLPVIVLLPLAAIMFSVSRGFSYKDTAIVILVAEGIVQVGYFAGLLIRSIAIASLRPGGALNLFKARRDPQERANDRQTSPSAGAGEAP